MSEWQDPYRRPRSLQRSAGGMVVAGTPWASAAGARVLRRGGNAFDAAAATLLALNVTYPLPASFTCTSPVLIRHAGSGTVLSYSGLGTAPQAATIELFRERGHDTVPTMSILAQLLPASPDTVVALLRRFGTRSFAAVSRDAFRLAARGFPIDRAFLSYMNLSLAQRLGYAWLMPYNAWYYYGPRLWRRHRHGERFRQPDLARTLGAMAGAETTARRRGADRRAGLDAVRRHFYEGPIADAIARLHQRRHGLITREDLAGFAGAWETPVSGRFRDCQVYANDTWTQGPVVPLILQILEGVDLAALGHNTAAYVHTVAQAIELAMADREAYFGDPAFVSVPIRGLLDPAYAAQRRARLTPDRAFRGMPAPGDPRQLDPGGGSSAGTADPASAAGPGQPQPDTSYLAVVDGQGNAVSLTPSDFPMSPMVPGTGICLGNRMSQFRLDPDHPAALAPGKRPRLTPNPSLVTRGGELLLALGTPGVDMQPQAIVQVLLNRLVFGMDIQSAIDAPRFRSYSFPDSFAPHTEYPGVLELEQPLYETLQDELTALGYDLRGLEAWHARMGSVGAIEPSPAGGYLGAADPREIAWAEGV